MKKYFVFADIHGYYDKFLLKLAEVGFDVHNPDHILVILGDLLDRGAYPVECLLYVLSLPEERTILIRGNHEDLLDDLIARGGIPEWHDFHNGTIATYNTLMGYDELKLYDEYCARLVDYAEIGDYVFVHGWVPLNTFAEMYLYEDDTWRQPRRWGNARWLNGMEEAGLFNHIWEGKTIVCGHFHTSWGHYFLEHKGSEFNLDPENGEVADFSLFKSEGIIALDGCVAYSGVMNCLIFEAE